MASFATPMGGDWLGSLQPRPAQPNTQGTSSQQTAQAQVQQVLQKLLGGK